MIKKVDHIGIAVRDAAKMVKFYSDQLGIQVSKVVEPPGSGLRIYFLPVGESDLELVEPLDPQNWIAKFIDQNGEGLHHICLDVDDIHAEVKKLAEMGVPLTDKVPRRGARATIAFLEREAADGVLIELSQVTEESST